MGVTRDATTIARRRPQGIGSGAAFAVMARITLLRPPPSLRSPVVGPPGSMASWNNSHGTRRWPPSRISMSSPSHRQAKKVPAAVSGLRAVHIPAPTPILGNFSGFSSRHKKNRAHHIPGAMLDSFTGEFMNMVQGAFHASSAGQKSVGLITKARFDSLVQKVMTLVAFAEDEGFMMIFLGAWGSTLRKCGTDLTKLAKKGKFDRVVGREKQIDQIVQILSRRFKNNPCLIGEPGVGKTAIVEGLAQLIAKGDVPETIKGKKVIAIDMTGLLAGTLYRGQLETRLKNLLAEVKWSGKIILFIDEVHTLIGAGSYEGNPTGVADIIKPALARGELQLIGATTTDEYKKHIEKDAALERRFGPVKIPEPTVDETVGILRGLRERYEKHHKVQYADEALSAAAELSYKYISDRFLPDKAIDLIDQAGPLQMPSKDVKDLEAELNRIIKEKNDAVRNESYKRAKELHDRELELKSLVDKTKEMTTTDEVKNNPGASAGPVVTEEDIRHVVSTWTGVPVQRVTTDETNRLLNMEETLHKRVVGQDEAVAAISRAIRRARAGLNEPGRPIGSFIFAGPTGVGKTELAKAVATFYYGSEDAMVRLDMSEFMDWHTVHRLIGSPPGYREHSEGGQLTEAVRQRPHTLVLFDEIEKAHRKVLNIMLQILDDGRLTDGKGRTVDFKNTLIIMTSNIGGSVVVANGHGAGASYDRVKELVGEEMKHRFPPEFLNRLDETIVFKQLTKDEVKEIAGIMLNGVAARVRKKGIELPVTERFKELVVEKGFDTSYGVRPLKRVILRLLDSLADKMLAGEIKEGDSVDVDSIWRAMLC
ncbi:Chaperone protein ClpC4, chloroplastic [Dichanthelium oligosanthes]|uniref:Chaperone protein ClpC4, chloroplastic n=1 Tax=Dichanthelium oligosanthes TaxID=888268 RepID=A0A1E5UL96_9POAL|nr:Chaperone protein ClpC4, chloroplastic [Dichanthelium oligosanthes]